METYANRGGDSGIVAYDIDAGQIVVEFGDGWRYLFTEDRYRRNLGTVALGTRRAITPSVRRTGAPGTRRTVGLCIRRARFSDWSVPVLRTCRAALLRIDMQS